MIVQRYEKGIKFLDLERYSQRSMDEDGRMHEDECWSVCIYDNELDNYMGTDYLEFSSETMARMFIDGNGWKEQVL